jgi:hypothetical protein
VSWKRSEEPRYIAHLSEYMCCTIHFRLQWFWPFFGTNGEYRAGTQYRRRRDTSSWGMLLYVLIKSGAISERKPLWILKTVMWGKTDVFVCFLDSLTLHKVSSENTNLSCHRSCEALRLMTHRLAKTHRKKNVSELSGCEWHEQRWAQNRYFVNSYL